MAIQFARGCPYNCEFCDIIVMYGRRPRTKSVAQVLAEVETIHALGVSNIFVVDDNFIGNKKEAKALLTALAAWQAARGYPIEFMTEVSLNVAQDDELLRLMAQAHFTTIFVGIESPRAASLAETNKTQNTREDIVTAVHRIQAAGIDVMAGMIVGFDHDDPSIFEEQFRFIQQARIPISMTGMLNAVPKTPLHERLRAAGRLIAESVGDQFVFTNIVPGGMSRLELYEGYRALLRRLYGYRAYRRRAMAFILNRGSVLSSRVLARGDDLAVVLRIVWTCILRTSPRRACLTLSMCLETAFRRPRAIRHAFTLALMHKHFYDAGEIRGDVGQLRAAERGQRHGPSLRLVLHDGTVVPHGGQLTDLRADHVGFREIRGRASPLSVDRVARETALVLQTTPTAPHITLRWVEVIRRVEVGGDVRHVLSREAREAGCAGGNAMIPQHDR